MKCPICKNEMEKGGIFVNSIYVYWYNEDELKERSLFLKARVNGEPIGKNNFLTNTTKIETAYYCKNCKKVMGIFDVADF
ncbi:PF20097 family protein [Anaerosphaera multitolerans]|uniref:DUF6487 domain-containing protein n=1 Tax=Anaerosphaera multitolerans TaxID=2487351 RepID=A0A437S8E0_9FIRM|nr:PF20097 family protein [Anaerosphaera multitolerans]RVU55365.1 hypothetical protein EF514_03585 [Anaerosphaera multitolerans]